MTLRCDSLCCSGGTQKKRFLRSAFCCKQLLVWGMQEALGGMWFQILMVKIKFDFFGNAHTLVCPIYIWTKPGGFQVAMRGLHVFYALRVATTLSTQFKCKVVG